MTLENQGPIHKFLLQNILHRKKPSRIFFSICRVYRQNFQEKKDHKFLHAKIYENVRGFFFLNRVKAECQAIREVLISLDLCTLTNRSPSNTNTGCVMRDSLTQPCAPKIRH